MLSRKKKRQIPRPTYKSLLHTYFYSAPFKNLKHLTRKITTYKKRHTQQNLSYRKNQLIPKKRKAHSTCATQQHAIYLRLKKNTTNLIKHHLITKERRLNHQLYIYPTYISAIAGRLQKAPFSLPPSMPKVFR